MPRSDFYRIILKALAIEDEATLAIWHRAYVQAKADARGFKCGEDDASGGRSNEADGDAGESTDGPPPRKTLFSRAPLAAAAVISCVFLVAGVTVGLNAIANEYGPRCDAAAGAHWDPSRNEKFPGVLLEDIRASAVEVCEGAVRDHPQIGRYWFQLGRAHDRDAKWHGNYTAAHEAFLRAHELGHSPATLSLGMLAEDGLTGGSARGDREPDLRQAAHYYELAAQADLAMGHYCHAIATLFGWSGEEQSPSASILSAQAAVAAGSRRAAGLIADLEARRPRTDHVECSREYGIERPSQAIPWGNVGMEKPA